MASTARRMFFFGVRNSRKATDLSGCKQKKLARPVRFELSTPCSGGMYSIHLSYGRAVSAPSSKLTERTMRCDFGDIVRLTHSNASNSSAPACILSRPSIAEKALQALTNCTRSNFLGKLFDIFSFLEHRDGQHFDRIGFFYLGLQFAGKLIEPFDTLLDVL